MPYSIGLAGKGGTGKTTLAGFMIRHLIEKGRVPVLAVDADANSNLNEVLGLEIRDTLGGLREAMKRGAPAGMTKDVFMEMKLEQAVVEARGFDLIAMGRPEGPGCYCAANALLTRSLDRLMKNYAYVVIDNEAGMEHISRLTTKEVNLLLVVSDPTRRGIQAAARICGLCDELNLRAERKCLVVNQARVNQYEEIRRMAMEFNLDLAGMIPEDPEVRQLDLEGRPTKDLKSESRALQRAFDLFDDLLPH